ncbi:hypothetical protein ST47_g3635 [Ascochyta rabiei]|uniref:Uncharacterized protein n=2 Tax=Didymella rabiei TaxID=5454 RepID=A0A163HAZ3_DIDRA|nr:hypothetical protein ST47_g3635 [Ascochyta rabiei]
MSTVVSEDVLLATPQPTVPEPPNTPPQPACNASETSSSTDSCTPKPTSIKTLSFTGFDAINYSSVILLAIIGLAYSVKSYWATTKSNRLAEESNKLTEESNTLSKMESCRVHPHDKALFNDPLCTEMRQRLDYDQDPTMGRVVRWVKRTFGGTNFKGRGRRLQDGYSALV